MMFFNKILFFLTGTNKTGPVSNLLYLQRLAGPSYGTNWKIQSYEIINDPIEYKQYKFFSWTQIYCHLSWSTDSTMLNKFNIKIIFWKTCKRQKPNYQQKLIYGKSYILKILWHCPFKTTEFGIYFSALWRERSTYQNSYNIRTIYFS